MEPPPIMRDVSGCVEDINNGKIQEPVLDTRR